MAYRERLLWVSALATLLIWGSYFGDFVAMLIRHRLDEGAALVRFIGAASLIVIVQVVAAIFFAVLTPKEANAPADTRERDFARRGAASAYVLLSVAVVMVMVAMPLLAIAAPPLTVRLGLNTNPATLLSILAGNALLLALIAAGLVDSISQLLRYRRGY